MKRLKLLFIGLCLAVISAQAQVVFSEDEKNFVVSQVTTPIQNAATTFTTNHGASCLKFKPSGIMDNWFVSARTGAAAFAGSPSGCGDLFDRVTPNLEITVGKWHTPYFGTRIAFDGFKFKTANLNKERYENCHLDLMLNISSFYHKDYEKIPKWNFVPYMGAGVIHNSLLHKTEFAINYGVLCSYRIADRLSLSAEVGAMATAQKFDGLGTGSSLRDNLFHANLGLTIDIGKQGWKKKSLKKVPYYHCKVPTEVSFYPKNNYRGLNELRERIKSVMGSGDVILDKNIDVPILFFFKINSTDFIDNQQKIELSEIAAAVKEYNLKVKVIGAADSRTGSNEYNRKLSIKRAKYIAKLLIDAGVQKEKLQGVSQGGIDIYKPYTANRHTCVILSKDNSSLENK